MSIWRQLMHGLRVVARRTQADADVDEEVRHYLDQAAAAAAANGGSAEQARRAARLELGTATGIREEVRAAGWEHALDTAAADVRYGLRRLAASPGFTIVVMSTLAIGIGASTAMFGALKPIVFEPLPYPGAERIVMISDFGPDGAPLEVTYGTYHELAERSRSFDALAVTDRWQPALTGTGEPERLIGESVTAGYFRVLGVAPAIGRDFDGADDRPRGPRVVIVSDRLARRRFGEDGAVLGRALVLDGTEYTIIGVMPRGFVNVVAPAADVWRPRQYQTRAAFDGAEWGHHMRMVGRLKRGATIRQARRDVDAIARTPVPDFARPPWASLDRGLIVDALQDDVTRPVRPALFAMAGAVCLVLIIACVNVAGLLLGRGAQRRGEFAMRAALGAGRGRLVRQLLTESVLVAGAGGVLGLGVAAAGIRAITVLAPESLPRLDAIRLDGPVFAFALAVTTLVGLAVGLVPAWQAGEAPVGTGIRYGRTVAGGHHAMRHALVVAEVALAIVLLVCAGLLLRSLDRLFAERPGFDAAHVLTMAVEAGGTDPTARLDTLTRILDAVRRVPGVATAAFTSQLPLSGDLDAYGVVFQSIAGGDPTQAINSVRYTVTPDYFRTMGIPLIDGRLLDEHDRAATAVAVLINQSFARRLFGDRGAVGQRFRAGPAIDNPKMPWATVVGVVGDVKQTSLALAVPDAFYVTPEQWPWIDGAQSLVVRTMVDPAALAAPVRATVRSVAPDQPIIRVTTMAELVARSEAQRRFALVVFEMFALAALVLAGIGLYGVLAGGVTERLREIGVRSALGASRTTIVGLVVRQGARLVGIGVVIGLVGAAAATGALTTLMFGISRLDPITYGAVAGLLVAVAGIASALPAWRAARIDPAITLRAE